MASREEQKRKLREERQAREAAEAKKAAGKKRIQLAFGALLGLAAIAGIVFAVVAGTGSSGGEGESTPADELAAVPIPARQVTDLDEAARKAGCEVMNYEIEGREHIADTETFADYKTNPPTSGTHRLTWTEDGFYGPEQDPNSNNWVHALEHGRILYQYKPDTPRRVIGQMRSLFDEEFRGTGGYHQIVLKNDTNMEFAAAAVAWGNMIGCDEVTDATWDALRAFRDRFVDKGPEQIP